MTKVNAEPFAFPRVGEISAERTALMVVDMQADFCSPGGYMDRAGADVAFLSSCIPAIQRVLDAARRFGLQVVHTREGFAGDLSDVQPWKKAPTADEAVMIGDEGPLGRALIRGEAGWEIVPELSPRAGEPVFDKTTYGAFASTGIERALRDRGIENLVLVGVTTDCCITSNLREALDRGFDCLVLEDCVAAASRASHDAAVSLMKKPSGIFGQVAVADDLLAALGHSSET